ncbi:MAG: cysteine hydrolase family protein [Gammaproteobacteria bacterium]|jgi:nicotinamidase-related amidase
MTQGLIIVDVQNDYFPGGAMELVGMDEAAANCSALLESFRTRGAPLFHIQHLANHEGAAFFVPGTPGADIHDSMTPADGEPVIVKHFPSAFRDTGLYETLQKAGVDELVICGAMSHMCIDTTVRVAFDLEFRCQVAADACATRDLEFDGRRVEAADVHAAFMGALASPFAQVQPAAAILDSF